MIAADSAGGSGDRAWPDNASVAGPTNLYYVRLVVTILLILFDYVFFDAPHRKHRRQR
jgi:hypothetical protein